MECGHKCAHEDWFMRVREGEHVHINVLSCVHERVRVCMCLPSFMVGARTNQLAVRDGDSGGIVGGGMA